MPLDRSKAIASAKKNIPEEQLLGVPLRDIIYRQCTSKEISALRCPKRLLQENCSAKHWSTVYPSVAYRSVFSKYQYSTVAKAATQCSIDGNFATNEANYLASLDVTVATASAAGIARPIVVPEAAAYTAKVIGSVVTPVETITLTKPKRDEDGEVPEIVVTPPDLKQANDTFLPTLEMARCCPELFEYDEETKKTTYLGVPVQEHLEENVLGDQFYHNLVAGYYCIKSTDRILEPLRVKARPERITTVEPVRLRGFTDNSVWYNARPAPLAMVHSSYVKQRYPQLKKIVLGASPSVAARLNIKGLTIVTPTPVLVPKDTLNLEYKRILANCVNAELVIDPTEIILQYCNPSVCAFPVSGGFTSWKAYNNAAEVGIHVTMGRVPYIWIDVNGKGFKPNETKSNFIIAQQLALGVALHNVTRALRRLPDLWCFDMADITKSYDAAILDPWCDRLAQANAKAISKAIADAYKPVYTQDDRFDEWKPQTDADEWDFYTARAQTAESRMEEDSDEEIEISGDDMSPQYASANGEHDDPMQGAERAALEAAAKKALEEANARKKRATPGGPVPVRATRSSSRAATTPKKTPTKPAGKGKSGKA